MSQIPTRKNRVWGTPATLFQQVHKRIGTRRQYANQNKQESNFVLCLLIPRRVRRILPYASDQPIKIYHASPLLDFNVCVAQRN